MKNEKKILIVDYQSGNKRAIENMIQRCGIPCEVTADPRAIAQANALILPGVGAFDDVIDHIMRGGLWDVLNEAVLQRRVPTMGLCVGFQIFGRRSEEGERAGFGWLAADVVRLQPNSERGLRVPNMGWHILQRSRASALFPDLSQEQRHYFAHSFHVQCDDPSLVSARIEHSVSVAAVVEAGHLFGVQGHPEKSHRFGMELFRNFARAAGVLEGGR